MSYLPIAAAIIIAWIAGFNLGRIHERNRQARIRQQAIRLRHFAPSSSTKN